MLKTGSLFDSSKRSGRGDTTGLLKDLKEFNVYGKRTGVESVTISGKRIPVFRNEFWTSKQRAGHSIHEISYRACFKPQLPGFFISRLCREGDIVYDPFLGRGTTLIEARLRGCNVIGNDVNPLSQILTEPRLEPPSLAEVKKRLEQIQTKDSVRTLRQDLKVFYHPETLKEICSLREYFKERRRNDSLDEVDKWILMVATNRLTGHSEGFFSVYTLPPNQAATIESQKKINIRLNQSPKYKDTKRIIFKKSESLLSDHLPAYNLNLWSRFFCCSADKTTSIEQDSVDLIITSPPFLDIVDYLADNWMRIWFTDTVFDQDLLWQIKNLDQWVERMKAVLVELKRVLKKEGVIAFEVGEVRNSKLDLDLFIAEAASDVDLQPLCIMRNEQVFTKTSNCWGIQNNKNGTNSNRIVILKKAN